jgi:Ni/Fe-hydrogenase b-type cytochrome subunit
MADEKIKYVWSAPVRIIHWCVFLSVAVLLVSGLYLAYLPSFISPPGEPVNTFFMAQMRFIHFVAAVVFDICVFISIYLIFFSAFHAPWRELIPSPTNLKKFFIQLKYYFKLSGERIDYEYEDPVDIISFLSFYTLAILLMLTGFALYAAHYTVGGWWHSVLQFYSETVVSIFGGLKAVHNAHHFLWWLILIWVLIHVYFQFWKTIKFKTGNLDAIFGGYRYKR